MRERRRGRKDRELSMRVSRDIANKALKKSGRGGGKAVEETEWKGADRTGER